MLAMILIIVAVPLQTTERLFKPLQTSSYHFSAKLVATYFLVISPNFHATRKCLMMSHCNIICVTICVVTGVLQGRPFAFLSLPRVHVHDVNKHKTYVVLHRPAPDHIFTHTSGHRGRPIVRFISLTWKLHHSKKRLTTSLSTQNFVTDSSHQQEQQ